METAPISLFIRYHSTSGLSGRLSGKALTFHQTGPRFNFHRCPVSSQRATLVGRVATPVILACGTQPVDQG